MLFEIEWYERYSKWFLAYGGKYLNGAVPVCRDRCERLRNLRDGAYCWQLDIFQNLLCKKNNHIKPKDIEYLICVCIGEDAPPLTFNTAIMNHGQGLYISRWESESKPWEKLTLISLVVYHRQAKYQFDLEVAEKLVRSKAWLNDDLVYAYSVLCWKASKKEESVFMVDPLVFSNSVEDLNLWTRVRVSKPVIVQ